VLTTFHSALEAEVIKLDVHWFERRAHLRLGLAAEQAKLHPIES
jgi:hypothetical protein